MGKRKKSNSVKESDSSQAKRKNSNSDTENREELKQAPPIDTFVVEDIRDMRIEDQERRFLVKWAGFPEESMTWEPETNMDGSQEMVNDYLLRMRKEGNVKFQGISTSPMKKSRLEQKAGSRQPTAIKSLPPLQPAPTPKNVGIESSDNVVKDLPPLLKKANVGLGQNQMLPTIRIPAVAKQTKGSPLKIQVALAIKPTSGGKPTKPIHIPSKLNPNIIKKSRKKTIPGNDPVPEKSEIFSFIIVQNGILHQLNFDIRDTRDESYSFVVTEDIEGLIPIKLFDSIVGEDQVVYSLVQFEGRDYIDVVESEELFLKFPSLKQIMQQ